MQIRLKEVLTKDRVAVHRILSVNLAKSKPNLDCNHTFPIALASDGIPFSAISGKV